MEVGSRIKFEHKNNDGNSTGVIIKNLLKLIEDSDYYDEVYESLGIDKIKDKLVEIDGANSLMLNTIKADEEFLKFDVVSELSNVRCPNLIDKKNIQLEFSNIEDVEIRSIVGNDSFNATSKYSVKSDYLDKIFSADKFMNYCFDNNYDKFIQDSLDYIQNNNNMSAFKKKFRVLKSKDGNYFVRAITSAERYKDYNIRFSVFVALIAINKLKKIKNEDYFVRYYSVSESDIRVVFSSKNTKNIIPGVNVGFELELVNDEIKRESVKFNGLFSLTFGKGETLSIKPDIKSTIIKFPHTVGIKKVSAIIENLPDMVDKFTTSMYKDVEMIKKIQSPKDLKDLLEYKVRSARMKEFSEGYKAKILAKLEKESVNTFIELLELMNKLDMYIDDSDIKVKDYWRFKLYETLIKPKNRS